MIILVSGSLTGTGVNVAVAGNPTNPVTVNVPSYGNFATNALSASYAGTASYSLTALGTSISSSYAVTASYALNGSGGGTSVSASYAATASYATTVPASALPPQISVAAVTASQYNVSTGTNQFVITGSLSTGILGVTEYITPYIDMTKFSGVVIEYMAQRTGGRRLGTLTGFWTGSSLSYTDVSVADIGDTSDISAGIILVNSNAIFRVNSAGSGSYTWTVQSLFRLFPYL